MKLTCFILFAFLMQVSAATFAQKVTLKDNHITLKELFKEIRKQTGYDVLFQSGTINTGITIKADFKDTPLKDVMEQSLKGQPLEFVIDEKTIIINQKETSFFDNLKNKIKAELAQITVSGNVHDETGQPLPGVTVKEKDTYNVSVTENIGHFKITVPDENTIIVFSYVGYETQELRAKDISAGAIIILKAVYTNLKEVVINKGYYKEKRELLTGDIGVVSAKEISQQPVTNPLEAMMARIPGIVITQTTGLPGGGFNVQIRGRNSLLNGSDPFYVIDGIPYPSQIPSSPASTLINTSLNGGSPLNYINPYDIETIEVLKDADATAIYGSRAANGAILITTKKGQAGKVKIDLNFNSGIGNPSRNITLLNTQQYLQMRHLAFKNDKAVPNSNKDYDLTLWDTTRYTNWMKELVGNTVHYTNAQASVSGGTTNTQYLIGADYNRSTTPFPTLLPGQGANELTSVHFNLNTATENKKLHLTITGNYATNINTVQSNNFYKNALDLAPDAPALYNSDGSLNWMPKTAGQSGTWKNPLATLYNTYQQRTSNLISNALVSYNIVNNLDFKTSLGYTNTQFNEIATYPINHLDPALVQYSSPSATFNNANTHSWIIEPQFDYTLKLSKSTLSILMGATFHENNNNAENLQGLGFLSDALLKDIQSAGSLVPSSSSAEYKQESVYARLNYNWQDKYILNVTARRDGSSRFGPGRQYGNFGAVGAAWIFTREKWISDHLNWLSFGKLRGSYGTTGNDQIGDYQFLDLYQLTPYPYDGSQGLQPANLFNTNLEWEVDKKLEGGIELGFLQDRINIQVNYFRNRSGNQLVTKPLSAVTGFATIYSNLPALVENAGWELTLNTVNVKSKNFIWTSNLNFTSSHNKLISFPGLETSVYQSQFTIGQPLGSVKVLHLLGVNSTTGLYEFEGLKGPTSTPNLTTDRNTIINTSPKFYGGLSNNLRYGNFTLDFLFQFVKQTGVNLYNTRIFPGYVNTNQPLAVLNNWRAPGDVAPFEQYTQSFSSPAYKAWNFARLYSDLAYSDASFIRLKNLSLSYNLAGNWTQRLGLRDCRIYLQGQNLLTFTNYKGIDPESQGLNVPPLRIYTLGIQTTF